MKNLTTVTVYFTNPNLRNLLDFRTHPVKKDLPAMPWPITFRTFVDISQVRTFGKLLDGSADPVRKTCSSSPLPELGFFSLKIGFAINHNHKGQGVQFLYTNDILVVFLAAVSRHNHFKCRFFPAQYAIQLLAKSKSII